MPDQRALCFHPLLSAVGDDHPNATSDYDRIGEARNHFAAARQAKKRYRTMCAMASICHDLLPVGIRAAVIKDGHLVEASEPGCLGQPGSMPNRLTSAAAAPRRRED
jgi:hypothetical protein